MYLKSTNGINFHCRPVPISPVNVLYLINFLYCIWCSALINLRVCLISTVSLFDRYNSFCACTIAIYQQIQYQYFKLAQSSSSNTIPYLFSVLKVNLDSWIKIAQCWNIHITTNLTRLIHSENRIWWQIFYGRPCIILNTIDDHLGDTSVCKFCNRKKNTYQSNCW